MSTTSSTSSTRTRATNLTGLIDIDALVKANILRQQTKLNTTTQKMKVEEYKQQQYREITTKSKTFYNKYFDILGGDSLLSSKTYNSFKASSDNTNVTATASSEANAGSYEVSVTSAPTSAKYQMTKVDFMKNTQITINNVAYNLTGDTSAERSDNLNRQLKLKGEVTANFSEFVDGGNGGLILQTVATGNSAELSVYISGGQGTSITPTDSISKAKSGSLSFDKVTGQNSIIINGKTINVTFESGADDAKKLKTVNDALTSSGITNVSAIADGTSFKLEAIEVNKSFSYSESTSSYISYQVTKGADATNATSDKLFDDVNAIISASNDASITNTGYFNIDGKSITISSPVATEIKDLGVQYNDSSKTQAEKDEIAKNIQNKLASALNTEISKNPDLKDKYTATTDEYGNVKFKSETSGAASIAFPCSVNGTDKKGNDGVNATNAYIDSLSLSGVIDSDGTKINSELIIDGKTISFERFGTDGITPLGVKAQKTNLKAALENSGFEVSGLDITTDTIDPINIKNKTAGIAGNFTCEVRNNTSSIVQVGSGTLAEDGLGKVIKGSDANVTIKELTTGLKYEHKGASNKIELDGITFEINSNATGTTKIDVKADGTALKDKIVSFINDYNDLLGTINGKLYEEHDRSYLPLTDEDKEGLSDSEIEKLEKKAQIGLLRNDSYLSNFADDMKLSMTTMLEDSGLNLERIGINPVKDYSTQNGLFTIDQDKLLAAIEEDPEEIQKLFSGENGIVTKLKTNLTDHATGTFSRLANRAGVAGGVSANTNEMTKDIEARKRSITEMQAALKEKEDALYVRYSSLESSLSSLQAQQSSLSSYFQ